MSTIFQWLPNLVGIAIMIIAIYIAIRIEKHMPLRTLHLTDTEHRRLADLEREISRLQSDIMRLETIVQAQTSEIERLKSSNLALSNTLADSATRARASEDQLRTFLLRKDSTTIEPNATRADMQVLLVMTADSGINLDITALRAAAARGGFRITRLYPATFDDLRRKLNRNREAGDPIKYVHIAAHMDKNGINLDRLVTPQELSEILIGVTILVLNGCNSDIVGDFLGVVPNVLSMREGITHADATAFARVYWEEVARSNGDSELALDATLKRIPINVAEFVELHN